MSATIPRRYSKKVRERRRNKRNLHPSPSRRRAQARYAVARALAATVTTVAALAYAAQADAGQGVFANGSAYAGGAVLPGNPSNVGHFYAIVQNFSGALLWNYNGSVSFQAPIAFYDFDGVPWIRPVLQLQDSDGTQFITQAPTALQMDGNSHRIEVVYLISQTGVQVAAHMAWAYDGAALQWTTAVIALPGHAFAPALNNGAAWFSGWPGTGNLGGVAYETGADSFGNPTSVPVYVTGPAPWWNNSLAGPFNWDVQGFVTIEGIDCFPPCQ